MPIHAATQERGKRGTAAALTVGIAFSPEEVNEAQRFRHAVFAGERGVRLPDGGCDAFDPYCQHVIVRNQATRDVVASTRVLVDRDARLAGGFRAETAFDLHEFLQDRGRAMEIDSTCVHADYRSGPALSLLFSGIARFFDVHTVQWLIVRASMPTGRRTPAVCEALLRRHGMPGHPPVSPRQPLPAGPGGGEAGEPLPVLLRECLAMGAHVAGPPAWNAPFACADLLFLLPAAKLRKRYARELDIA